MRNKLIVLFTTGMFFTHALCYAQAASDYLILQDIGNFKFITQSKNPLTNIVKLIPGYSVRVAPGILAGADHFDMDHDDKTYEMNYDNSVIHMGVEVQVTKHSGGDSDKWLLHEIELSYQKSNTLGAAYAAPNPLRDIGGNKILFMWGYYAWVSNKVVVSIKFTDLTGTKPEPLEVVRAYLQKFPSTIPATVVLDNGHKIQWMKDEMDRRLWLCDKWFYQLQLGKVEQNRALQESVAHMGEFLDYREKYYGIKAADEKNLLASYLNTNNGTGIKTKLAEYKNWWSTNKDKAITLP